MAQLLNLGQFEHLAILLTLVAVLWLLARDLGYKGISLSRDGMADGEAHSVRFYGIPTGANNGGAKLVESFSVGGYEPPVFTSHSTGMDQVRSLGTPIVNGAYYGEVDTPAVMMNQQDYLNSKGVETMKATRANPYDRAVGSLDRKLNQSLVGL
jgi:hypothetical protein